MNASALHSENSCSGTCSAIRTPPAPHHAHLALLPRRSFVRTIALMSAGSWLAGKELSSLFVADVEAQNSGEVGVFRVDINQTAFLKLKDELGSVLVKVTGMPASFSRIIITRQDGVFHAVSSRCTHQGTQVNPFTASTGALRCPNHGSRFNPDGSVVQGPANSPLESFSASFDGASTVAIEIPGLGFNITTAAVLNPANNAARLRIEFPSVTGVSYAVRFRASLTTGDWTPIPFATAINAAAATTVLTGNNTRKTVFVDRAEQLGFYAVTRTS